MAKQCHAIFFDVTFTSCDHNVFVVEQGKKHLLSRKQFKHSKLSQFTLLFFWWNEPRNLPCTLYVVPITFIPSQFKSLFQCLS